MNPEQNPFDNKQFVNPHNIPTQPPTVPPQPSSNVPPRQVPGVPNMTVPPMDTRNITNDFVPQRPMSSYAPKKSHKGLYFFLFILIIILLGVGYGAYAWVLHPENAVKDITNSFATDKIISINTKLNVKSDTGDDYSSTIIIDLDRTTPNATKSQIILDVDSQKFTAGLELKYLNEKLYGQITNYPVAYKEFFRNFANKWYSIETKNSTKNIKTINADELYGKLMGSGVFTGIRLSGISLGNNGPVRNYIVDVNPEILKKSNIADYSQALPRGLASYAGMAGSYTSGLSQNAKISPILVTVGMFSGKLEQISFAVTNDKDKTRLDAVIKYDGSKSQIEIDAPEISQSLNELISGFMNPTKASVATTTPSAVKTKK